MGIDEYSILKKKQKKNAFAATALLVSIAIALLVMVGAVLILSKVNDNDRITSRNNGDITENNSGNGTTCEGLVKEIVFNDNLKTIKEAAISYFTNERLPQSMGEKVKITLREMQEKRLLLNVRDASANSCDGNKSYVEVTKSNNEYLMKILLSCSDLEDHIIVHLGCYDYCDKDVCEKEEEKIEEIFEYEYKKTTSCVMSDWSSWGSWKTTREKTSNLKKEDIKTETASSETTDKYKATADPTTYNCNKYPDYKKEGSKCVKTETIAASKTEDTYNCDKYGSEYKLEGNKCVKKGTVKDEQNAAKNEATYSCPSGYTRSTINYTVKKGDTLSSIAKANNVTANAIKIANKLTSDSIKVGQKLTIPTKYQKVCYKDVSRTDTQPAKEVYGTRYVNSTCYDNVCSSYLIPSCTNGYCDMQEVRTCEKVPRQCQKPEQYVTGWSCAAYGSEYGLSGNQCIRYYTERVTKAATKNTDTYNCDQYPGYTLSGTKCYSDISTTDEKPATVVSGKYYCNTSEGYSLTSDNKCTRTITKDADKNPTTYSCKSDYTLTKDNMCVKVISTGTKITYYRYATRTCDGGKTYTEWSLDKNDKVLLRAGYKLTGVKRAYQEVIK